jgi:hypothetical protein
MHPGIAYITLPSLAAEFRIFSLDDNQRFSVFANTSSERTAGDPEFRPNAPPESPLAESADQKDMPVRSVEAQHVHDRLAFR